MIKVFGQVDVSLFHSLVVFIKLLIHGYFHIWNPFSSKTKRFLVKFESILADSKIPEFLTSYMEWLLKELITFFKLTFRLDYSGLTKMSTNHKNVV